VLALGPFLFRALVFVMLFSIAGDRAVSFSSPVAVASVDWVASSRSIVVSLVGGGSRTCRLFASAPLPAAREMFRFLRSAAVSGAPVELGVHGTWGGDWFCAARSVEAPVAKPAFNSYEWVEIAEARAAGATEDEAKGAILLARGDALRAEKAALVLKINRKIGSRLLRGQPLTDDQLNALVAARSANRSAQGES